MRRPACRSSSTGSGDSPSFGTTNATTVSPVRGCGSPTTATSATAGWLPIASSTSPGYTLNPETMTTSLARSTSRSQPSSSATAMSPVYSQPSASHTVSVASSSPEYPAKTSGPRTRTSPGSPSTTSSPSLSTSRTSTPGNGGPIEPRRGSGTTALVETTGDASVSP